MREFFWRIRRSIRWLPVLWRDQTFDYQFTMNILEYSLEELAVCLENGITASGPNDAQRIRYVCNLIRRLDDSTAWDMTNDGKKADELEDMYWDEIWTTIQKYGQGWWD